MTVEELIRELSEYPKDTPIYINDGGYYDSDVTFEDLLFEIDYGGLALEVI